jgi:hypothetical protein
LPKTFCHAQTGDAVFISTRAALQNGIVIYGQQASSNGHVAMTVCSLSGTTMSALSGFPIRSVTFR